MAINLANTGEILWTTTYFSTLTQYTLLMWINPTAYNVAISRLWQVGASSGSRFCIFGLAGSGDGTEIYFQSNPNGGTAGVWKTTTDPVSLGANQLIVVTFDNTSVANDPIIYHNGTSQAITEVSTPNGTGAIETADVSRLGRTTVPYNGIALTQLAYNRILSASEISDAYASRLAIPSYRGLVFAPNLNGAAGGVTDGSTLAAANEVTDIINGSRGVPAGSPVLRASTYLTQE